MGIRRKLISKWYVTSSLVAFLLTSLALFVTEQYLTLFVFTGILSWVYFLWLCYTIFVAIIALFRLLNVYQLGVLISVKIIFLLYTFISILLVANITFGIYEEKEETLGYPLLEMKVIEYPEMIEDTCKDYTFKIEVKNIGEKPLTYKDLELEIYSLELISTKLLSPVSSLKTTSTITDFGTIEPGEIGTITYTPRSRFGESVNNGFNIFPNNGDENFYFQITTTTKAEINKEILGSSNEFILNLNHIGIECN